MVVNDTAEEMKQRVKAVSIDMVVAISNKGGGIWKNLDVFI